MRGASPAVTDWQIVFPPRLSSVHLIALNAGDPRVAIGSPGGGLHNDPLGALARAAVETRITRPRQRAWHRHHRPPPAARHQQVEQDRASSVLVHQHELACQAAGRLSRHRRSDQWDDDRHLPDGLTCEFDSNFYPKGVAVFDAEMEAINLVRNDFHGEWNYTIQPTNQLDPAVDP